MISNRALSKLKKTERYCSNCKNDRILRVATGEKIEHCSMRRCLEQVKYKTCQLWNFNTRGKTFEELREKDYR